MILRKWLAKADFNLALSSSFFGFYAHLGVVTALFKAGFRPKKVTGASAGALVGAAVASGLGLNETRDLLFSIKREDFWDPGLGVGFLRGDKFRGILKLHFAKDFSSLQMPFEVAVFDIFSFSTKFINAGSIASAVSASCAVPIMFHPVSIDGRWLWDGGLVDRTGINHSDRDRTLCVYLDSSRKRDRLPKLASEHRVLRLSGLPRPHPMNLDVGREAFDAGLRAAEAALDREI